MQFTESDSAGHHVVLLGYPLAHSVSPAMHHAAAAALGIKLTYRPVAVTPALLADEVARLRDPMYLGANITVPHKTAMLALVDALTPFAQRIGAINTVYKAGGLLMGENTDAPGFIDALRLSLSLSADERVLVLGAGGAARAAVAALIDCKVRTVALWNRTRERALELVSRFALDQTQATNLYVVDGERAFAAACRDATLLVNATSAGLQHGQLPVDFRQLSTTCRVFDMLYGHEGTAFTREARAAGLAAVDGLWMLVFQAARSFTLWTGLEPDSDLMHEAATRTLASRSQAEAAAALPGSEPVR